MVENWRIQKTMAKTAPKHLRRWRKWHQYNKTNYKSLKRGIKLGQGAHLFTAQKTFQPSKARNGNNYVIFEHLLICKRIKCIHTCK